MTALTAKTTIPLWGMLLAVPTLTAAVLAFGFTTWQTTANAKSVEDLRTEIAEVKRSDSEQDKKYLELVGEFKTELREIKTILKERNHK